MINMKTWILNGFLLGLLLTALASCQKYLDAKPDGKLVVPTTVRDAQALLDYYHRVNNTAPGALENGSDDYYLTEADFNTLPEAERRQYTWEKDYLFPLEGYSDWSYLYDNV